MSSSSSPECRHNKKWHHHYHCHHQQSSSDNFAKNIATMMTSLHNQITEDFKVIHQSINTVSHQVTQLESGDQPVLVNGEQSLASTTGLPEQSLRHDAESSSTQSCRETQPAQEAPVDTSAQTRTDPLPGTNALKTILQTMKRLSTGPQLNLILSQESH